MILWLTLGLSLAHAEPTPPSPIEAPPAAVEPSASTDDPAVNDVPAWTAPGPVTVTLIDTGEDKRKPLTLRAKRDDHWQLQLQRTAVVRVGDTTNNTPGAIIETNAQLVDSVVSITIRDADLIGQNESSVAAMRAIARVLRDKPLTTPFDAKQRRVPTLNPSTIDNLQRALVAELSYALEATTIPLPNERVGIGASWTWTRDSDGVSQAWTATLKGWENGDAVVGIASDTTVREEGQDRAHLVANGTIWQSLRRPLAQAASLKLTATSICPPEATPAEPAPTDASDAEAAEEACESAEVEATLTVATRETPRPPAHAKKH